MNEFNDLRDITQFGTQNLLSYLDRLKTQAEELLRGVRGVCIKTNPIIDSLKMKYEEEIPLEKEDYVREIKLIDDNTVFILYTNCQYVLYDFVQKTLISKQTFHPTNYSNLQILPEYATQQFQQQSKQQMSEEITLRKYLISYFDLTLKHIVIYDLQFGVPISFIQLADRLIEDSLAFRVIKDEMVVTYKKGDVNEEDEGASPTYHSYQVYALTLDQDLKINWNLKTTSLFTLGGLFNDKVFILKNKSLILYNSFTRSTEPFIYQEFKEERIRLRQRESPLSGQVIDFIEFSNSNKIGFIINIHSDSQFKFIVHDLDQVTEITEQSINFLQITKQVLITNVFCFVEDRYIGLCIQNIQYGARNIIYDIESQSIVCLLEGHSIVDTNKKGTNLRMIMHKEDDSLEDHSLKVIYFMKPKIPLMKYLEEQGILKLYGEQACKEIIEMIH